MNSTLQAPSATESKSETKFRVWKDEELESFQDMVDKTFVRKGAKANDYFYKIISTHPRADGIGELEFTPLFNVQKYFRGRKIEVSIEGGKKKEKRHEAVPQFNQGGKLLDSDASFFIPCTEFLEKFERQEV